MLAARLHGPKDIRTETIPAPSDPAPGEALIRVTAVGICGSDLHTWRDGHIGGAAPDAPLILGHEFAAVIEALGEPARDGTGEPLRIGQRVAVDPAQPCGRCELCEAGHPNLCPDHAFTGVWPTQGALCERMLVPAATCFPVPDTIDDEQTALLEPLGVALHAVDLGHVRVGHSAAVIGAGSIGLLIAQVLRQAGADPILITDRVPGRLTLAERFGARAIGLDKDPVATIHRVTRGRGVDVAFEAAWSDESAIRQATDALRPGGRLVVVGIAGDDRLLFHHATARRKGLTIAMCRRMKHTYPRAIALAEADRVDLAALVSHRFPLAETGEALATAAGYTDDVVKVMVRVGS